MSTTSTGREAEAVAAHYLKHHGYEILAQNWRTRWCEIDIVAEKTHVMYFVEVKYRQSAKWGGGLDYITPKKLAQMQFAAEFWVSTNSWSGDYRLSAIEVSGPTLTITKFLKQV